MSVKFVKFTIFGKYLLENIDNFNKMMYNNFVAQKEQALGCQVRNMHVIYLLLALLEVRVLPLQSKEQMVLLFSGVQLNGRAAAFLVGRFGVRISSPRFGASCGSFFQHQRNAFFLQLCIFTQLPIENILKLWYYKFTTNQKIDLYNNI